MTIKLIIGLQNPGSAYEQTRHNAGGWFVETLTGRHKTSFQLEKKLHARLASLSLDDHACKTMLPTSFMNHSGMPTRAVCQFYKIEPEEILVVHDELDLPPGRIKLKSDGGNGGHNGLRDITAQLGSSAFHRLRIGIGHPGSKELVLNYVLGKPSSADREQIIMAIEKGLQVMPLIVSGDFAQAMNLLNS